MAKVIFASQAVGAVVLPLMLFHQIQLMVCARARAALGRPRHERRNRAPPRAGKLLPPWLVVELAAEFAAERFAVEYARNANRTFISATPWASFFEKPPCAAFCYFTRKRRGCRLGRMA